MTYFSDSRFTIRLIYTETANLTLLKACLPKYYIYFTILIQVVILIFYAKIFSVPLLDNLSKTFIRQNIMI